MKKMSTGFEIVDSASDENSERCICSEDSAFYYYGSTCGCGCGCKGPSGDAANDTANDTMALQSQIEA